MGNRLSKAVPQLPGGLSGELKAMLTQAKDQSAVGNSLGTQRTWAWVKRKRVTSGFVRETHSGRSPWLVLICEHVVKPMLVSAVSPS